jgi:DNA-binding MarR family transcriptional regulator
LVSARFETLFKRHRLSGPKYNVLRILRGAKTSGEDALPCLEVAERMITRVPDITRLVDRLVSRGLVARRKNTDDRRVVWVSITSSGLKALESLDRPTRNVLQQTLGHMTAGELTQLSRLLEKARRAPEQAESGSAT